MSRATWFWGFSCVVGAVVSVACGSSGGDTTGTGGQTTASPASSGASTGETTGSTSTSASVGGASSSSGAGGMGGAGGAACSGATPATLTIKNYLSWCDVAIGNGAPSGLSEQTVCVADGMTPVVATAHMGFTFNAWHGTVGDMGSGETKASTSVNVMGNSACAWVCCNTNGAMDCPTMNQCP
jgi:hypothetical protein